MITLGMNQMYIQKGVGTGNITINKINPARSIAFCPDAGGASLLKVAIVDSGTINCNTSMSWVVIEFGGGAV